MSADRPRFIDKEYGKIFSAEAVALFVADAKKEGKIVGLITGCFDILHISHINFFRESKKYVDILVVGLERDETISISKGHDRPVNNLSRRAEMLSELESIDLIFPVEFVVKFIFSEENNRLYERLSRQINPSCLITNIRADDYW